MKDLEGQIRAYAQQLDGAAPPATDLAPDESRGDERGAPIVDLRTRRATPAWVWAGVAAAAVAVVVGSTALVGSLRPDPEDPAASTTTSITDTTVAVEPGPGVRETPVTLVSPIPVIGKSTYDGDDEVRHFTMGEIVKDGDLFHTLLGAEGKNAGLHHASSSDGSVWTVADSPVDLGGIEDVMTLRTTTLIRLDDGTWRGYFDIGRDLGGVGDHRWKWWIHTGTAPSIDGPWTLDPTPVIDEGAEGSWDGGWLANASVSQVDGQWTMFYLGSFGISKDDGEPNPKGVGLATSSDGLTWTKAPAPVFVANDTQFEDGNLTRIQVKRIGDGFVMTYAGRTGGSRGLAYSSDGSSWQRDDRNPVLTTLEVPRASIYDTALVDDDGVFRWYAVAGGFSGAAVYELVVDLDG